MASYFLRTLAFVLSALTFFYYFTAFDRQVLGLLQSDMLAHIDIATHIFQEPPVYPLFHLSVYLISKITNFSGGGSAIFVLLVAVILSGIILAAILYKKTLGRYSLSAIIIFTCCLLMINSIYVPSFCEHLYLCNGSPNSIHNPTSIFAKPFGFLAIFFYAHLMTAGSESKKKFAILSSVFIVLATLAKPNLMLAFLGAVPLLLLIDKAYNRLWGDLLILVVPLTCLVAVLGIQFYWTYLFAPVGDDSKVVLDFLGVARLYSPSPPISVALLAAFPIATILFYPDILKDRFFSLSFVTFIVAVAQYWFLAEAGNRYAAGNFGWALEMAIPLVFVLCLAEALNQAKTANSDVDKIKISVLSLLFLAHLISGVMYARQVMNADTFF